MNLREKLAAALVLNAAIGAAAAQAPAGTLPLPPNYKTTFENADVLVMKVHYGAHEFVPMHDHSAFPTVYLYLNDSGEVQLKHEGADGEVATRPPTHTGAFRISPGVAERHSVQSQSDTDSDFLRVELKRIPPTDIQTVIRGAASTEPGSRTDFKDAALKIDRTVCPTTEGCTLPPTSTRSLLIAINKVLIHLGDRNYPVIAGDTMWLAKDPGSPVELSAGAQVLRISLLYPE